MELFNYTVIPFPDNQKKILLQVILEKIRSHHDRVPPDELALLLRRPMVSESPIVAELLDYLKLVHSDKHSANNAQNKHNAAYRILLSKYEHLFPDTNNRAAEQSLDEGEHEKMMTAFGVRRKKI